MGLVALKSILQDFREYLRDIKMLGEVCSIRMDLI